MILLQNKIDVFLVIFSNIKVQVQNLTKTKQKLKELTLQLHLFQDSCSFSQILLTVHRTYKWLHRKLAF